MEQVHVQRLTRTKLTHDLDGSWCDFGRSGTCVGEAGVEARGGEEQQTLQRRRVHRECSDFMLRTRERRWNAEVGPEVWHPEGQAGVDNGQDMGQMVCALLVTPVTDS